MEIKESREIIKHNKYILSLGRQENSKNIRLTEILALDKNGCIKKRKKKVNIKT
jgi:hypothetical protein